MRGVLTSGESESLEFRFSRVVTVVTFLSLVAILDFLRFHEADSGRESLIEGVTRGRKTVRVVVKMSLGERDDNLDPAQLSTSRMHTRRSVRGKRRQKR